MALTYYRYDDASAPSLNGTVGSLIALLDACLVTGYGAKPAAGWTKPFTGTNKAVFRMASGAGKNGHYLRIVDDGSSADGAARTAFMSGFSTMSDVDTGTEKFPEAAYCVGAEGALMIYKSYTLDSVARPWLLVADDVFFTLYHWQNTTTFIDNPAGAGSRYGWTSFGQFDSQRPGDIYNTMIVGRNNGTYSTTSGYNEGNRLSGVNYTANPSVFIMRDCLSKRVSATANFKGLGMAAGASTAPTGGFGYPNVVTGKLDYAELAIVERNPILGGSIMVYRGKYPGIRQLECTPPSIDVALSSAGAGPRIFDVIDGSGSDAGKSFLLLIILNNSSVSPIMLQISGTF